MSLGGSSSSTCNNRKVGYRFRPTDGELVGDYLRNKLLSRDSLVQIVNLPEVNSLHELEPWQFPLSLSWPSEIDPTDKRWYFFCRRNPNCKRVRRFTKKGFWSITGNPRKIRDTNKKVIGFKRTMTYYYKDPFSSKKKKENKTNWVIHEYYLDSNQNAFVLCKLKKKEQEAAGISSDQSTVHSADISSPEGQTSICLPNMSTPEGQASVYDMPTSECQTSIHGGQTSVRLPDMSTPEGQESVCYTRMPDMPTPEGQLSVADCLPDLLSPEGQTSMHSSYDLEKHHVEDQNEEIYDKIGPDDLLTPSTTYHQDDDYIWSVVDFGEYHNDPIEFNQQNMVVENGDSSWPSFDDMSPIFAGSPLKRSRVEDGGLNTDVGTEGGLIQHCWLGNDHAGSSSFQQLPTAEGPSTTIIHKASCAG